MKPVETHADRETRPLGDAAGESPSPLRIRRTGGAPRVRTGIRAGDMYLQADRGSNNRLDGG